MNNKLIHGGIQVAPRKHLPQGRTYVGIDRLMEIVDESERTRLEAWKADGVREVFVLSADTADRVITVSREGKFKH